MGKILGVILGCLGLALVAPAPAQAAVTITINEPQPVDADTALLTGTVEGRTSVTIQHWAAGRWRNLDTVPVAADGSYRATVEATDQPVRHRAKNGWTTSEEVVVVARAPEPEAEPEPDPAPEPEPAPEPGPTTPTDDCGPVLTKADGSRWTCTLSEDFDGTELDRSVWMPQTVFRSGSDTAWACYLDDPSTVSVHDGALHLTARKLPESIPCAGQNNEETRYVSGSVTTYRLFSQQYGRFEARMKNTATDQPGLHEAFWLWPDDRYTDVTQWPASGEIDISETYSQYPDLSIPFLHYTWYDNWGPRPGLNTAWDCYAQRGEWNTYTLEWSANRIEIFVNGKSCLVNTSGDPAFQKPYIVALTQLLGTGANAYDGRAPLPATTTVDYVRVWK